MNYIIFGNILALIASLLMVVTGLLNEKKKILLVQSIQLMFFVFSNLVLKGFSGAIVNFISLIRNILGYKDKLHLKEKIIITVLSISLGIYFNNLGFVGLLPIISTVVYIWCMTVKDVSKFKMLLIFTMIMWFIYDFSIKSYTSSVFDFVTALANIITLIKLKINRIKN